MLYSLFNGYTLLYSSIVSIQGDRQLQSRIGDLSKDSFYQEEIKLREFQEETSPIKLKENWIIVLLWYIYVLLKDEMENRITEAGQNEQPESVLDVVSDVLAQHTQKNKFLQNVGIKTVLHRTTFQNLEAELATEKRANEKLQLVVNTQREKIDVLLEQVQQAEEARLRGKEEMQKKQSETDAKLELLLSQLRAT